jgi:hypothetical protein
MSLPPSPRRDKFGPEEDKLLTEAVQLHGESDWSLVATFLPGRNARQCRERWFNYVNPHLVKRSWTLEEDSLLVQKYNEFGPHWNVLCRLFDGRGRNDLKNRLSVIRRKQNRESERFRRIQSPGVPAERDEDILRKGIFALLNTQASDSLAPVNGTAVTVKRFVAPVPK